MDIERKLSRIVITGCTLMLALSGCVSKHARIMPSDVRDMKIGFSSNLVVNRRGHSATRLSDGKVLLVGGETYIEELKRFVPVGRCEVFDPKKELFFASAELEVSRTGQTATLLDDGTVLIAGGKNKKPLFSTEILTASQNLSISGPALQNSRYNHTATKLPNGKVLLANGISSWQKALDTVEIYSPATKTFRLSGKTIHSGEGRTATLLDDGRILFTGGTYKKNGTSYYNMDAELFDPVTEMSEPLSPMMYARAFHTATKLANGKVLIVGGRNYMGDLKSAEIYDPETRYFYHTGLLSEGRSLHTATAVDRQRVLISGGSCGKKTLAATEIYDVLSGTFSPGKSLNAARRGHTATLLAKGTILLAGGGFGERNDRINLTSYSLVGEIFRIISKP